MLVAFENCKVNNEDFVNAFNNQSKNLARDVFRCWTIAQTIKLKHYVIMLHKNRDEQIAKKIIFKLKLLYIGMNLLNPTDKHIDFAIRQIQIIIDNANKTLEECGILADF